MRYCDLLVENCEVQYLLATFRTENLDEVRWLLWERFEELCKISVLEQFAKESRCQTWRWSLQIGLLKILCVFFSLPVPNEGVALLGWYPSVGFHNLPDHVQLSLAQMMAALFIALFVLQISFDLIEYSFVERILPLLSFVESSFKVETGHFEYWLDVVFRYLYYVCLFECFLFILDLFLAEPLRNACFGNSVKYCLLFVDFFFLLLLRVVLVFRNIVNLIDGLFFCFISLLHLHFLFNHLHIVPFLW